VGVISETPSLIPVADEPDASQEHRHAPSSYERPIKGLPRWAGILTPGIRSGPPLVTPRVKPRSLSPLGSWLLATVGQPSSDLAACPSLAYDDRAALIQADDVKRILADIDAHGGN